MTLEIPEDVFESILQFVPTDFTTLQNVQLSSKKLNSIINKPAFWESRIKNFFNLIDIDTETQEWYLNARKIIDEFGVAEYLRRRREWSHLSLLSEWKRELFWTDELEEVLLYTRKIFTTPIFIAHKKGQFSSFEGWSLSRIKRFIGDMTFLREFGHKIREVKHQSECEYQAFLPFIMEGDELRSEDEAGAVVNSEVLDVMEACDSFQDNSSTYHSYEVCEEAEPTEEEEEEEEQLEQSEEVTKVKQAQVEINGEWKKVFDVCEKDILQLLKTYAGKPEDKIALFQAGRGQVRLFPVYAVVRSKTGNYVGALAGSVWT